MKKILKRRKRGLKQKEEERKGKKDVIQCALISKKSNDLGHSTGNA